MTTSELLAEEERRTVRLAALGDERALARLLRDHYPMLYRYLLKVTMHKAMAEDLAQETMLKAIERIGTFKGSAKFSTWLISIGTRLFVDEMRRKGRERKWHSDQQAMQALRFEAATRREEWPMALDALGEMPYDVRVPILLKYYYGYAYEEIARWLDIPVGTVKSRLHNGLKQLRKELEEDVGTGRKRRNGLRGGVDIEEHRSETNGRPGGKEADADTEMEAEFQALLGGHLRRWDERIQPPQLSLDAAERLVAEKKRAMRESLLRELLLLWAIGAFVIGGLLLLLLSSRIVWFAGLQAAALTGAALFLTATAGRNKEAKQEWTD